MTPAERTLRARLGAYSLHAKHDPRKTTAPARASFLAKFDREVDPDGLRSEAECVRRASCARKAYFAKLALKSSVTRRKKTARSGPGRPRPA